MFAGHDCTISLAKMSLKPEDLDQDKDGALAAHSCVGEMWLMADGLCPVATSLTEDERKTLTDWITKLYVLF